MAPGSLLVPRYQLSASAWREKWKAEDTSRERVSSGSADSVKMEGTRMGPSHWTPLEAGAVCSVGPKPLPAADVRLPCPLLSALGKFRSGNIHLGKQMKPTPGSGTKEVLKSIPLL